MERARMRIGVTGASGMLGTALVPALQGAGHEVVRIGRGPDAEVRWNPAAGLIDAAACEGVEAFVHLAGANVGRRWTPARRREIRESRVAGTMLIARTAAGLAPRPRVLVCASAVGVYGNSGDAVCDESTPPGHDFLADVVRAWESSADAARVAGIRTVHLRFGVILSRHGGALGRLLPVFRLGVGGCVGNGRHWMSWVSVDDAVGIIHGHPAHPLSPVPHATADAEPKDGKKPAQRPTVARQDHAETQMHRATDGHARRLSARLPRPHDIGEEVMPGRRGLVTDGVARVPIDAHG